MEKTSTAKCIRIASNKIYEKTEKTTRKLKQTRGNIMQDIFNLFGEDGTRNDDPFRLPETHLDFTPEVAARLDYYLGVYHDVSKRLLDALQNEPYIKIYECADLAHTLSRVITLIGLHKIVYEEVYPKKEPVKFRYKKRHS